MEGPPLKKARSSSPSSCDNDLNWMNEFNSELPDELNKLVTCNLTIPSSTSTSIINNNNTMLNNNNAINNSSSNNSISMVTLSKDEETIQKNKNLSQLLSTSEPRPHHPMSNSQLSMMNRGGNNFRHGLMPQSSMQQMMANRQRAFMPSHYMSQQQQQQQQQQQMYHHNNQLMMNYVNSNSNNIGPNGPNMMNHAPYFSRHKSMPGNMAITNTHNSFIEGGLNLNPMMMSGGTSIVNPPPLSNNHQNPHGINISVNNNTNTNTNNINNCNTNSHSITTNSNNYTQNMNSISYNNNSYQTNPLNINSSTTNNNTSTNENINPNICTNNNNAAINGPSTLLSINNNNQQNDTSNLNHPLHNNIDNKNTSTPSNILSPENINSNVSRSITNTSNNTSVKSTMLSLDAGVLPVSPAISLESTTESLIPPTTTTTTMTSTLTADEKRWEFQKTLHLLLHAHKCQQRDKDSTANGCNVPRCLSMKNNLKHMAECLDSKTCKAPQCPQLRLLIQHYRNCKRECPICGPVRKILGTGKNLTFQQQQQQMQQLQQQQQSFHSPLSNSLVSTLSATSSASSLQSSLPSSISSSFQISTGKLPTSCFNSPKNNLHSVTPNIASPNSVPSSSQPPSSTLSSTLTPSSNPASSITSNSSNNSLNQVANNTQNKAPSKEWQLQVMPNLRNHLVQRLVHTIFPNHDVTLSNSERMQALIQYARKLEGDMYDSAGSKEEYYQLLAEKIYKIQRELEEKKMKRANGPSTPIHPPNMHNMVPNGIAQGMQQQQRMFTSGTQPRLPPQQFMDHFSNDSPLHHPSQQPPNQLMYRGMGSPMGYASFHRNMAPMRSAYHPGYNFVKPDMVGMQQQRRQLEQQQQYRPTHPNINPNLNSNVNANMLNSHLSPAQQQYGPSSLPSNMIVMSSQQAQQSHPQQHFHPQQQQHFYNSSINNTSLPSSTLSSTSLAPSLPSSSSHLPIVPPISFTPSPADLNNSNNINSSSTSTNNNVSNFNSSNPVNNSNNNSTQNFPPTSNSNFNSDFVNSNANNNSNTSLNKVLKTVNNSNNNQNNVVPSNSNSKGTLENCLNNNIEVIHNSQQQFNKNNSNSNLLNNNNNNNNNNNVNNNTHSSKNSSLDKATLSPFARNLPRTPGVHPSAYVNNIINNKNNLIGNMNNNNMNNSNGIKTESNIICNGPNNKNNNNVINKISTSSNNSIIPANNKACFINGSFPASSTLSCSSSSTPPSAIMSSSFINSPSLIINRQPQHQFQQQQTASYQQINNNSSNKNSPYDNISNITPRSSGSAHINDCSTPVHTPVSKAALGTPNSVAKQDDASNNDLMVKSEPQLMDDFKYGVKNAGHEDITDDENEKKLNYHDVKNENFKSISEKNCESSNGFKETIKSEFSSEVKEENESSDKNSGQVEKMEEEGKITSNNESIIKMENIKSDNKEGLESDKEVEMRSEVKSENNESKVSDLDTKTPLPGKKVFSQEELYSALNQVLEHLHFSPDSLPFKVPVDPIILSIPDYYDIIKNPMDLQTIGEKLRNGVYKGPWEFVDDVALMFDNAWLYNKKTSKVYKCCSKLAEVFDSVIDEAMQQLGFCCGRRYVFSPQVLCCFGKQLCSIPRDTVYYNYLDRYIYCEKCFNELQGEQVEMVDDPSQPGLKIEKKQFKREKNDKLDYELFVNCKVCDRKMHQICAMYMNAIWNEGFVCKNCLVATGNKRRENKYTAKRLPTTKLGTYLETRVNSLLKKKNSGAGEVTIRVLSSYDKVVEVKQGMKSRYVNRGEMPECYPYRVKAMFAFEEIDGTDVCFFGMHVQEYGSDCQPPNARRVYIAYLDSVHFFQPRHLRTTVYHEILIGYLEYAKSQGYEFAHIWACPPSEGDDYIFHCHPPDQKIPKPKRLQDWYKKMLDKAYQDRVIVDYKDIHKDAIEGNIMKVTDLPYFEGDFWPNILEECIKDMEQEEVEKRRRAEEEAAQDTDDLETDLHDRTELDSFAGKKKGQKTQKKKNTKNKKPSNRKNKSSLLHSGNDLSAKLLSTMEKHKEGFFVIRLQSPNDCPTLIRDPDPLMNCDLMDGRDAFLTLARDKHYEFSSLRRAKFSSMGLLYELHNQAKDGFIYSCNDCRANVETRYHCSICDDYDLCVACYKNSDHPHKSQMKRLGLDLDGDQTSDANKNAGVDQQGTKGTNAQEARSVSINSYMQSFVHACHCRDANCRLNVCQKFKRFLQHLQSCKGQHSKCRVCKQLLLLCWSHAKQCKESKCPVPYCLSLKQKIEEQKAEAQFKSNQLMRRRMAIMQRQPALDRGEQTPQPNNTSDPPTPNAMGAPHSYKGGGAGTGGGKFLHMGGSPAPNQVPQQNHQSTAALMAAHQAEQIAQNQRQPVYNNNINPPNMAPGNQMMMGGCGGSGSGGMMGGPAMMMSGGGPLSLQQQRMMMMQQHGHMVDCRTGQYMSEEVYRQQQQQHMLAMQQQQLDPSASNQMALMMVKKKEGMMKSNAQMMMMKQGRARQMTPQMMSAGGQMMDGGMMEEQGGMMMANDGMLMEQQQQIMGARMMSPAQQQQHFMMVHHQQQIRSDYPGRPQQFPHHHPSSLVYQSAQRMRGMGGFRVGGGGAPMHPSSGMIADGMDGMYMQQQQQFAMQHRRMQMNKQASLMRFQMVSTPASGYISSPPNIMIDMQQQQMSAQQQQPYPSGNNIPSSGLPPNNPNNVNPNNPNNTPLQAPPPQQQSGVRMMSHDMAMSIKRIPSPNRRLPNYADSLMMQQQQQQPNMQAMQQQSQQQQSQQQQQQQQQQIINNRNMMKMNDQFAPPATPQQSNPQQLPNMRFNNPNDFIEPIYQPQTPSTPNPNESLNRFVNNNM